MKTSKLISVFVLLILLSCKDKEQSTVTEKEVIAVTVAIDKELNIDKKNKEVVSIGSDNTSIALTDCNQTFEVFFKQFGKDSVFQKTRIKYPLIESYIQNLEPTIIEVDSLDINNYEYYDFTKDKNAMDNQYGKYNVEIKKVNDFTVYYEHLGYDNGIHVTYKFNLIRDCWHLVEIEDRST